jgi:hypothetical protein
MNWMQLFISADTVHESDAPYQLTSWIVNWGKCGGPRVWTRVAPQNGPQNPNMDRRTGPHNIWVCFYTYASSLVHKTRSLVHYVVHPVVHPIAQYQCLYLMPAQRLSLSHTCNLSMISYECSNQSASHAFTNPFEIGSAFVLLHLFIQWLICTFLPPMGLLEAHAIIHLFTCCFQQIKVQIRCCSSFAVPYVFCRRPHSDICDVCIYIYIYMVAPPPKIHLFASKM